MSSAKASELAQALICAFLCELLIASVAITAHARDGRFEASDENQAENQAEAQAKNLKVYVMVGFHVDFYHSWRGDTPDETGYGYDHRIIASSIRKLNEANAKGLKAKAYWDFAANNWTFGEFVPRDFPDLVTAWKSRDDNDEFVVGPFNNGLNAAATKKEFTEAIRLTLSNRGGYGLKQMFHKVSMIYRPQEMFFASGQAQWLHDAGIQALILQYATYSFNAFSNFIKPMATADRFNPIWFKSHESDQPIVVLPSMSPVDLLNFDSLKNLMIDLRKKQLSGEIKRNLVIHLNMDADAVSWEPMIANKALRSIVPNTGGLQEIIDVVNSFAWSDFVTPSEYLKIEQPQKTITVTQDMADGAFDGMASWAEKASTQEQWTKVEKSRSIERLLNWREPSRNTRDSSEDSGFFNRLLALSTTHFGMSVPFVHYQRQARLENYTEASLSSELSDLRQALAKETTAVASWFSNEAKAGNVVRYFEFPRYGQTHPVYSDFSLEKHSLVVPKNLNLAPIGLPFTRQALSSTQDVITVFKTGNRADVLTVPLQDVGKSVAMRHVCTTLHLNEAEINRRFNSSSEPNETKLNVALSAKNGVSALNFDGETYGLSDFFSPFISMKTNLKSSKATGLEPREEHRPSRFTLNAIDCPTAPDLREVEMQTRIDLSAHGHGVKNTLQHNYTANLKYKFWRDVRLPYLFLDVHADLPYTVDETASGHVDRRYMQHIDWRWQEIALSQIKPNFGDSPNLNVWKMNYEGLLSHYSVKQGDINPRNKNLDSMNNHLTPGWVAVSNGKKGLLIAFNATRLSSFGAIPMRVTTDATGAKTVALNPFGSYFGRQPDFSHVGGERLGTLLANMGASYIKPNAPSFNGKNIDYELMIAPYQGDQPPQALINAALIFAYPAIGFVQMRDIAIDEDSYTHEQRLNAREFVTSASLEAPSGFGAAAMNQSIDTAWTKRSNEILDGYQIVWRKLSSDRRAIRTSDRASDQEWHTASVGAHQFAYHVPDLENNALYELSVRSFRYTPTGTQVSPLSLVQHVRPSEHLTSQTINSVSPNLKLLTLAIEMVVKQTLLRDPDKQNNIDLNAQEISPEWKLKPSRFFRRSLWP